MVEGKQPHNALIIKKNLLIGVRNVIYILNVRVTLYLRQKILLSSFHLNGYT